MTQTQVRLLCRILLCLSLLGASAYAALAQSGGQTLYNGITLPQQWPPSGTATQVYPTPSYITNPPSVIPIDVGRQLFVDDFLIQQTSMTRTQHQPVMYSLNPILSPGPFDTGGEAIPSSDGVWFDPADNTFKMWFHCGSGGVICYAYSMDGKTWTRPSIPDTLVPNTDEVLSEGVTVWMDLQDPDTSRKFKAFAYNQATVYGIDYYYSADGIHWTGTYQSQYPIVAEFDRTTLFWNAFLNDWVDSMKNFLDLPAASSRPEYLSRARNYAESPDLMNWKPAEPANFNTSFWTGPDVNDPPYVPGGTYPQLYNLDAVPYESVMVGLFSWFYPGPGDDDPNNLPGPDLVELGVGFSRDGFQWVRPTRGSGPGPNGAFIAATNVPGTWNMANTQSAGGCFLVVGDELWFYFSGRNEPHAIPAIASTGLATLRRDGFYSMDAGSTPATLTTRPVQFSGEYLFVNVNDRQGSLTVQVLNTGGTVLATSLPLTANKTLQQVSWTNGLTNLSAFAGQPVQFQFTLTTGELYSFWVSANTSGASNGYVAANGPGFTGPVDTLGSASYPTTAATPEISPAGGLIASSGAVTIFTGTLGATIYYTTDRSTPTTSSPVYTGPFQLPINATVQAISSASGLNSSSIASASFTVDRSPPSVFITSPTNGQTISGQVTLSANASDNNGVASVTFLIDGASVGTVTSPPYSLLFEATSHTNAIHQITAVASDLVGNQGTSLPVTINVENVSSGPTTGLVGYWSFDSPFVSGNTLFDQSGNNNNATSFFTTAVAGEIGQALHFNGSSSYAQVPSASDVQEIYDLLGDLSLSLWVQTTNSVRDEALISKFDAASTGYGYLLRTTPAGTAELLLGNLNVSSGNNVATDVTKINDGNWHHIAVVIKLGVSVTFYVDGALSSSFSIDSAANSADSSLEFGLNPYAPYGNYFTGTMDEVRIYDRALSAGDVASLFHPVSITPSSSSLYEGQSQSFAASVQNSTNQNVTWSISPSVGAISSTGFYTAPATIAAAQTVTVTATSVVTPSGSESATCTLNPPIMVSLSPQSVTVYQGQTLSLAATVQNSANQSVTWSISPGVGSISSSGVYTAPLSITTDQTVTVTASSVATPSGSGIATITLSPPISVSMTPTSATLYPGQSQPFTPAVQNSANPAVTWILTPSIGSISATGVYTAPQVIAAAQTVTLTATSVATPSGSASASISLSPPPSVSLTPPGVTLSEGQSQIFAATIQNSSNRSLTWSIIPNVGSISSSGTYTAPQVIASAQTVTIQATLNGGAFGTASVNLLPPVGAVATYLKIDTATQGNWEGKYGADGYALAGISPQTIPSYAVFQVQNELNWTWASSTTDPRALQTDSQSDRIAATWYSGGFNGASFSLDVNFMDGNSHQVALYALDWDNRGRNETIQIVDANSGNILNQETINSFTSGVYLIWNISGHVTINVLLNAGDNAVISGIFFGGNPHLTVPTITWTAPSPITYGTPLSSTQLNAGSSVGGSFSYSPAEGTVLAAGTQSLSVTFIPTDTTDYATATSSVALQVNKAQPPISWTPLSAITYGAALGVAQLNATSSVGGNFAYTPPAGTVLAAGAQNLSVIFTPNETTDYTTASSSVPLNVNQAAPVITWTTPASITTGTALSSTQLNASSSVPSAFSYDPAAGAILNAGNQTLSVTFTPIDTKDYSTATATVTLSVTMQTVPTITWGQRAPITYATPLSSSQLNASASVGGSFVYAPAAGTVLGAGIQTLSVTFTPSDTTHYAMATAAVTLVVSQATPVVAWATPAPVTSGTILGSAQLNASASVGGSFSYTPSAGTAVSAGTQTLSVRFTPTDTLDYTAATATVSLVVNQATAVTNQASFLTVDTTTQGSWQNVYGQDGYVLANVASQKIPAYATFAVQNQLNYTWNPSTSDPRALQIPGGSGGIAATWYSPGPFNVDVNIMDGASHEVALYALDWDNQGREETIQVLDGSTSAILDTRTISGFNNGLYLVWNISGSVKIVATNISGSNDVISAVFFGSAGGSGATETVTVSQPTASLTAGGTQQFTASVTNETTQAVTWTVTSVTPVGAATGSFSTTTSGLYLAPSTITAAETITVQATSSDGKASGTSTISLTPTVTAGTSSASYVVTDTTTQGLWPKSYGADGYALANVTPQNIPSYATFSIQNQANYTWSPGTSDPRALQIPSGGGGIAPAWYSAPTFSLAVNFTDGASHEFALYALDWDSQGRAETIQIVDAASNHQLDIRTLSNFTNGVYVVWNISGNVKINVTVTSGPNAVVSGVFFGGAHTVALLSKDTTTQGAWQSKYGTDGYVLANVAPQIIPSYATFAVQNEQSWTWASSTSDPRALQIPGGSAGIAATWYSNSSFKFDVNVGAGSHQFALYAVDWDTQGRSETILIHDAVTGLTLDTESISDFSNGIYLVWSISGNLKITVTSTGDSNCVISGAFFK